MPLPTLPKPTSSVIPVSEAVNSSVPPPLIFAPLAMPPDSTSSRPPLSILVAFATPPDETISSPPWWIRLGAPGGLVAVAGRDDPG
jgi:hypothetical protein